MVTLIMCDSIAPPIVDFYQVMDDAVHQMVHLDPRAAICDGALKVRRLSMQETSKGIEELFSFTFAASSTRLTQQ